MFKNLLPLLCHFPVFRSTTNISLNGGSTGSYQLDLPRPSILKIRAFGGVFSDYDKVAISIDRQPTLENCEFIVSTKNDLAEYSNQDEISIPEGNHTINWTLYGDESPVPGDSEARILLTIFN
ncbi:MAG: hypothetical protein SNJ70_11675 [Armatimonadota bacterium]